MCPNCGKIFTMNKQERSWILYDWANSAFTLIIVTAIFPLFFKSYTASGLKENVATAYFGYANTIASIVIAVLAPIMGTIADYKGNKDNYNDYLNFSVFPSSSYFVEEEIAEPLRETSAPLLAALPDTIKIQACLNYGFREEYAEMLEILNDPNVFNGRIKATAVKNEEKGVQILGTDGILKTLR